MDNILDQYERIVTMLGGQFGESCQVILYTLHETAGDYTGIVDSVSGSITEARPGDPLPSFLPGYIEEHGLQDQYGFINKAYPGLVLRSSVHFIFDQEQVTGCLCIHHNIVHINMITSFLQELSRPSSPDEESGQIPVQPAGKVYEASNIQDFLDSVISEFLLERLGNANFAALEKNDKLALIAELDQRGVFLVKGAVNQIARRMNISKFSIYNYLDEIRSQN